MSARCEHPETINPQDEIQPLDMTDISMKQVVAKVSALAGMMLLALPVTNVLAQQGDPAAGEDKISTCVACHGTGGNDASLPDVALIGGQNEKYMLKQLIDIKEGNRDVPVMTAIVANLSEEDMADISAWYASQPEPEGAADPELAELGETIYRSGIADQDIAACAACHSPTGNGIKGAGYPALSGQDVNYTTLQLEAFRAGNRQNDDAAVMRSLAERLTDREIEAVASYVSGLR